MDDRRTPELVAAAPDDRGGLSAPEAARRQAAFGPNDPMPRGRSPLRQQLIPALTNPLVIILLLASAAAFAAGKRGNALLIVLMVVLSIGLNLWQTLRSLRAAEGLRERVAPTATVVRDGAARTVPRSEVVPGDLVRLAAGDLVPADATLLEARDLHVQEAALTGESLPAEKEAAPSGATAEAPTPGNAAVFLGTSVVSGNGLALVTATGRSTRFGDIAVRLAARPPETEFERGTRQFGLLIMRTVFFLVLFVLLVNLALHRPALESLLFALALAVGLTPEFLPMITSVTLAQGALRMSRQKVIVKHLSAIQNFGSIDILCSDKTGTLTTAEVKLDRSLDPFGAPSQRPLALGWLNSTLETGIQSALDAAVAAAPTPQGTSGWTKVDEIPFDFERRRLSIVIERAGGGGRLVITKGAPESVLDCCVSYEAAGARAPLDETSRERCLAVFRERSGAGDRVLAVAFRELPDTRLPAGAVEKDLVLAGFLTFADPPREDAAACLAALRRDGVRVKILTGDNELVARRVCAAVGLENHTKILLGADIDRMLDGALGHAAEQTSIFARVTPAQKNRILLALKRRGHVVGFLGDGINDAPSLHAADVGISVATAVDVAKDAAEILLLERSLGVLHNGILEGRKAFGNVMKYVLMGTSSNFGNMFSMAAASLFLPFLPMLPTQILLNNFLYDLAQITIPTDNVDRTYVRKPQRWDIRVIRDFMLFVGPISSVFDFLTFGALLYLFRAGPALFQTGWFVESLATQTLVLFVIRTAGNPLRSRPSLPLVATTLTVVAAGIALPFTPIAASLGFVPLPFPFFLFLAAMTGAYLMAVELAKRRLFRRHRA
jgi:Mg2+-importing ATPase